MSLVDSGVKRQRLDASTWLLSGQQTGAYEGGEEADGEDGEDIEDEVDDEDMWEDAGGADGVAPAPDAAHTLMMPTSAQGRRSQRKIRGDYARFRIL